MIDKNTKIGTICQFSDLDPMFKGFKVLIEYQSDGMNDAYFSGIHISSPVGMICNAWHRNRFSPVLKEPENKPKECQHEWIKYVGFSEVKMICKHCNIDQ